MKIIVGLSYGTAHKAVKKILHFHPYKVTVVQELLPPDYERRVQYCNWFNANLRNDDLLDLTFFSDESWFHLSGYINSQNYRVWSAENPHVFQETQLHPLKIGMWIAISRRRIIGPVFFEDTVTAACYQQILETFINQLNDEELQRGYFQHDNATAHTAGRTVRYLEQFYGERIIGAGRWPARSPDLTPPDYCLFGILKNTIYQTRLHTLDELKDAITVAVRSITPEQLVNIFENMKKRVDACLAVHGGHFEHVL